MAEDTYVNKKKLTNLIFFAKKYEKQSKVSTAVKKFIPQWEVFPLSKVSTALKTFHNFSKFLADFIDFVEKYFSVHVNFLTRNILENTK